MKYQLATEAQSSSRGILVLPIFENETPNQNNWDLSSKSYRNKGATRVGIKTLVELISERN